MSVKIRTVTYFTSLQHEGALFEAAQFLATARKRYTHAGYTVQSGRVATDAVSWDEARWRDVDRQLADHDLILNGAPISDRSAIEAIPDILATTQNIFCHVALEEDTSSSLLQTIASTILQVADRTGTSVELLEGRWIALIRRRAWEFSSGCEFSMSALYPLLSMFLCGIWTATVLRNRHRELRNSARDFGAP